ncbi:MAG: DUF3526 domain-containing protein [Bacteroidota bacterium]
MSPKVTYLFAEQTFTELLKRPSTKWIVGLLNLLAFYALLTAYAAQREQQATIEQYRQEVRARWEANPDKHPHRMAHYGYVALRPPYDLSFFDRGIDNYVGTAIFLEAHRQNTVNYSAASLSTGLLRFGELSGALVLQALVPLLIFFWGFALVAGEREDGKLRLIFAQRVNWAELIFGKAVGLFAAAQVVAGCWFLVALLLVFSGVGAETWARYGLLVLSYEAYFFVLCLLTIWVSTLSKTAKTALLRLIGCWLLFVLVLPKVSQVAGQLFFPSPSKIAFDRAVEEDLLKQGDSHNPDDPFFKGLQDSVLAVHGVASTKELPFNYSGFIMREGEKLSTATFREHEERLLNRYTRQQDAVRWTAFLNPYVAIKYVSMALAGTDFRAYRAFKDQAEDYRYLLAQTMNELQMEHISNNVASSADKKAVLDRHHWRDFAEFAPQPVALSASLVTEGLTFLALIFWAAVLLGGTFLLRRPISVI